MYLILAYCFLPFAIKIKELITLFLIILINVVIVNEAGNFAVVVLLVSVSIYIAAIRKNRVINVSAKYCYATHELRLHQNDRCKRFTLF